MRFLCVEMIKVHIGNVAFDQACERKVDLRVLRRSMCKAMWARFRGFDTRTKHCSACDLERILRSVSVVGIHVPCQSRVHFWIWNPKFDLSYPQNPPNRLRCMWTVQISDFESLCIS